MKVTVEDATLEQVRQVEDDIRPEDLREWYAGSGLMFSDAVERAFKLDDPKKVALLDGTPAVFWGWHEDGSVWLFATETAVKWAFNIQRILRKEIAVIQAQNPIITAIADGRNVLHHKWLRWLGFVEQGETYLGPLGLPFKVFTRKGLTPCA